MIIVRQVGLYLITTDGAYLYCNGRPITVHQLNTAQIADDRVVTRVVDTACRGANGQPDYVGLTEAEYDIHVQACWDVRWMNPAEQRDALASILVHLEDAATAERHARVTDGRYLRSADHTQQILAARRALASFDAAHAR